MLKLLQEEYLERTRLLNALRDKEGNLPPDAVAELDQLALEQDELAELTRNMVVKFLQSQPDKDDDPKPKAEGEKGDAKPGDSPDKLPDLDKPLDLDKLLQDEKPRKGK
ncbi:MAG: hypothetical protein H7062_07935 [Candidatus Saccharimonas sp.]|nr:hypothetical protein [Planctomycetaceae bacterium]